MDTNISRGIASNQSLAASYNNTSKGYEDSDNDNSFLGITLLLFPVLCFIIVMLYVAFKCILRLCLIKSNNGSITCSVCIASFLWCDCWEQRLRN